MALLTDEPLLRLEELTVWEADVAGTLRSEGISWEAKAALARREMAELVERCGATAGHVVVTPTLRELAVACCLRLIYEEAHHRQLAERYASLAAHWATRQMELEARLRRKGPATVAWPVPKAVPPTAASSGTEYVYCRATNVGADGREGAASEAAALGRTEGGVLVVWPGATTRLWRWNLYAGLTAEDCRLQNDSPLLADEPWELPAALREDGRVAGNGQEPDGHVRPLRRLGRG